MGSHLPIMQRDALPERPRALHIGGLLALIAVLLWLPGRPASAQSALAPLRLTRDAAEDSAPQILLGPEGDPQVIWLRRTAEDDRGSLWAMAPAVGEPRRLAVLPPQGPNLGAPAFSVTRGAEAWLAWPQPVSGDLALQVHELATGADEVYLLTARPPTWIYAVDPAGRPQAAWAEGNTVTWWSPEQAAARVFTVPSAARLGEVSLAIASDGHPWLAWTAWDVSGLPVGVYVADPLAESAPVLVAPGGRSPRLLAVPDGPLTLFWADGAGLRVASQENWKASSLVAARLRASTPLAVAANAPGRTVAVWHADGRLWIADATSWAASRRAVAEFPGSIRGLTAAVDAAGTTHLAWSAWEDGSEEIFYLCVDAPLAQLQVVSPASGDALASLSLSARLTAVAEGAAPLVQVSFWAEQHPLQGEDSGPLTYLGLDTDSADGWSAPAGARLGGAGTWRVVAIATDAAGRHQRATGDWFVARDEGEPALLVDRSAPDPVRGLSALRALPLVEEGDGSTCAFTLVSRESDTTVLLGVLPKTDSVAEGAWRYLPFDSRALADGEWTVLSAAAGGPGECAVAAPGAPFLVDNAMPPKVSLLSPQAGAVLVGDWAIQAAAEDADGRVERVEFYISRSVPALGAVPVGAAQIPWDAIWLGSDVDGSDGWSVEQPADSSLDGDAWLAWAVAYDERGFTATARTAGTFALTSSSRPVMRFGIPSPGTVLRGVHPVTLHTTAGLPGLGTARVYAVNAAGTALAIGEFRPSDEHWQATWDTSLFSDGEYSLLAMGEDLEGRQFRVIGGPVVLANDTPALAFRTPEEGTSVSGRVLVGWETWPHGLALETIRLYRRGPDGALTLLGEVYTRRGGWTILWDTRRTPDGQCDLVAVGWDSVGPVVRSERSVRVRNVSPEVHSFRLEPAAGEADDAPLSGEVRVSWTATHPASVPLTARLEYSPVDTLGSPYWLPVAADLPGEGAFVWDTRQAPDATAGRLRVTVSDGVREASALSAPLAVNNTNEVPWVALITPQDGQTLSGAARVVWQAEDPDGDPIAVRVAVRTGSGEWTTVAGGDDVAGGETLWDTTSYEPGDDIVLRVTAEDPSGAVGFAEIAGLTVLRNTPPKVRLLSPRGEGPLRGEAVVLWQTSDADGDSIRVDLYASDDAGLTWLPLAENLADTGYYVWQFSFLPSGSAYRLRVVARDGFSAGADQSGLLIIDPEPAPEVRISGPLPGQEVQGVVPVTWSALPPAGEEWRARLAIRARGEDWRTEATGNAGVGLLLWDTTSLPAGDYDLAVWLTAEPGREVRSLAQRVTVRNESLEVPRVRLLAPLGGETWNALREVRWEVKGSIPGLAALLSVSTDAGRTWQPLATTGADSGFWLWDTTAFPDGDRYLVRIEVRQGEAAVADRSAGVFRLEQDANLPPEVQVLPPEAQGGRLSDPPLVRWSATDPDGDALEVALDLSENGQRDWRELADGLPGEGEYTLQGLTPGSNSWIRLRASDGRDVVVAEMVVSGANQSQETVPTLRLEEPLGEESWSGRQQVRWSASWPGAVDAVVDVTLSADGGRNWEPVAERYPNIGVLDVDTTAWANGVYILRLAVYSEDGAATQTSGPFVIDNPGSHAPVVSLVTPRGGENWAGVHEVRWAVWDADGDAATSTIETSVDGGATWGTLAQLPAGSDSYLWDTTSVPNCHRVLLRVVVSDGQFRSQDTLAAPLAISNASRPAIALQVPAGTVWTGTVRLAWAAQDPLPPDARVALEWSVQNGGAWRTLAADLPATGSLLWDSAAIPEGTEILLRARLATDEELAIDVTPAPVRVLGNAPPEEVP